MVVPQQQTAGRSESVRPAYCGQGVRCSVEQIFLAKKESGEEEKEKQAFLIIINNGQQIPPKTNNNHTPANEPTLGCEVGCGTDLLLYV